MRITTITGYLLTVVLTLGLLPLASAGNPLRLKPVEITYTQQVHLKIASDAVNRISFDNFRVLKIIGNTSGFDSILSDQGSDLFITPKLPAGSKIDFSSVLASGDIIDFSLNVIESKTPSLIQLQLKSKGTGVVKSEAVKMIEAMRGRRAGKYYIQQPLKKTSIQANLNIQPNLNTLANSKIKVTVQDSYRFRNLHGIVLLLQNTDRTHAFEITASTLAANFEFERVAAIALEREILPPKGTTTAYIIFKGGLE